jgi:hypothetical protein
MANRGDEPLTIDTHHHTLPDFFWRETDNAHAPVGGLAPLRWSKEATLSFMDDAGIDVAVVSLSTPGVHRGDSSKARALGGGATNSRPHSLEQGQTGLQVLLACISLPDVDASLEELSYAFDVLGDGCLLFTNANGVYLGEAVLEPVFEELERRKAVVYVVVIGSTYKAGTLRIRERDCHCKRCLCCHGIGRIHGSPGLNERSSLANSLVSVLERSSKPPQSTVAAPRWRRLLGWGMASACRTTKRYCLYRSTTAAGLTFAPSGSWPNSRRASRCRSRSQHWSSSTLIFSRRT